MMERSQLVLGLAILIFLGVAAILVLAILHRRKLHKVSDQLAEGASDNGETLKGVVKRENDATRKHVSNAVDGIRNDTKFAKHRMIDMEDRQKENANEMRGQITAVKDRLQWLIKVIDVLGDRVGDAFKVVFARKPPEAPKPPKDDAP